MTRHSNATPTSQVPCAAEPIAPGAAVRRRRRLDPAVHVLLAIDELSSLLRRRPPPTQVAPADVARVLVESERGRGAAGATC